MDVEPDDVTGDHGLEDGVENAIDDRERLRRCGTGGVSPCEYDPNTEGARLVGVPFKVNDRSSGCTLVELFQGCLRVCGRLLAASPLVESEDVSGSSVRL